MKILDIKDDLIKIDTEGKTYKVSSFLTIACEDKKYISQIIQCENDIVLAKVLFDSENTTKYNGEYISFKSEITETSFETINKSFEYIFPVICGEYTEENTPILIDKSAFNNDFLISYNDEKNLNIILNNLRKQFIKNNDVVIIDTTGDITGEKYNGCTDFKIPLNAENLKFIYDKCLNNATEDSKLSIKEIFNDLEEYAQTVDFLPFTTLKNIVNNMVDKSHIFKLLVLKNELLKLDKLGIFAEKQNELFNFNLLKNSNKNIINLSNLDATLQNKFIETVYSDLSDKENAPMVFLLLSEKIQKSVIKNIYTNTEIKTTFIVKSDYNNLIGFKELFSNYILEANSQNKTIFRNIVPFFNSVNKNKCVLIGKNTKNIPLISDITLLEDSVIDNLIKKTEDDGKIKDEKIIAIEKKSNELVEQIANEVNNNDNVEDSENIFTNDDVETKYETIVHITEKTDTDEQYENNSSKESNENPQSEIVETNTQNDDITVIDLPKGVDNLFENDDDDDIQSEKVVENYEEDTVEITENESDRELISDKNKTDDDKTDENIADIIIDNDDEITDNKIYIDNINNETDENSVTEDNSDIIDETISNADIQDNELEEALLEGDTPITDNTNEIEIISLDNDYDDSEPLIIDNNEELNLNSVELTELDKEIAEDVDKVFTTIKEEDLSDSDLDFIDELNNESIVTENNSETTESSNIEELETLPDEIQVDEDEDEILEPLKEINDSDKIISENNNEVLETKNATTPMVPVYDAEIPQEDRVISDTIEQGDIVTHIKFGQGVVEKLVKYGSKNLAMINFDNNGRKLLDPIIAEIKKV